MIFLPPSGRRLAGAERRLSLSQGILNRFRGRIRAAEDAPRDSSCVLERRHGLAEIVERGAGIREERPRVIHPQPKRDIITFSANASRHGCRFAEHRPGFFEALKTNTVLLGSAHTEKLDQPDVAYVYVVPRRQRVKLNVKKRQYAGRRQKRLHDPATWSNASHIMLLRQRALARVFVRGVQRWPVFYAFEEAIRFCVKAYGAT